jgi:hypothetical protein
MQMPSWLRRASGMPTDEHLPLIACNHALRLIKKIEK